VIDIKFVTSYILYVIIGSLTIGSNKGLHFLNHVI